MNKYLVKLAESSKKDKTKYLIPASTAAIPVAAIGAAKHFDLGIRDKHGTAADRALNSALRRGNIKTTLALSGLAATGAAATEAYRQHIIDEKAKKQTKALQTTLRNLEKTAKEDKHDWRPAVIGGVLDIPAGAAVSAGGIWASNKFLKGRHAALAGGVLSGIATAAAADYMQRRTEAAKRLGMVQVKSAGVGKHNLIPDSKFPKKELSMGRKVELEHTSDTQVAENIAKDHLSELPDYYTRLRKMEKSASKVVRRARRLKEELDEASQEGITWTPDYVESKKEKHKKRKGD